MQFLPIFSLGLMLPLAAQQPGSAIIIEEVSSVEAVAFTEDSGIEVDNPAPPIEALDGHESGTTTESDQDSEPEAGQSAMSDEQEEPLPEQPEDLLATETDESVSVKVEEPKQIEISGKQKSKFQLITPWAPKPMQAAPYGWRYIPASSDKAYPVQVTLNSGKKLTLNVIPYTLVPEDSKLVVQAREPGYQPEHGYQQKYSVSARLQTTTQNLNQAAESLDESIANLSALVDSLPK